MLDALFLHQVIDLLSSISFAPFFLHIFNITETTTRTTTTTTSTTTTTAVSSQASTSTMQTSSTLASVNSKSNRVTVNSPAHPFDAPTNADQEDSTCQNCNCECADLQQSTNINDQLSTSTESSGSLFPTIG